jgi:adenylate cyclase
MLIGLYSRSFLSFFFMISIAVVYTVLAYICFKHNIYIGVSKQLLAIIGPNMIAMVVQAYFENKEKKFIESSFKQYISPELIDEMVAEGNMPELGGEESNITAYFTDIQGFSTFSEKIGSASKLVELLNEYLTAMTDVLTTKNKGTLDKYEGDAIIAFFGAPMKYDDHAKRACNTAIDMQSELLRLRKKWQGEGNKWPEVVINMHMRIGINTGHIVTGNMGSTMRKNYTMMGDEVNLASRLESAAKQYGAYIHVCKNTIDQLVEQKIESQYIYRSLDIIRVVGKDEPVETFELLAYASDANALVLNKLCELWKEARAAYLDMQWDKAIALFTQCLDFEPHLPERDPGSKTCPSQVYIKRCLAYKQNPPASAGEKWDGIFTATEK